MDLNFSSNPWPTVSKTHLSEVIFSHSEMKCFSLPPTGKSWSGGEADGGTRHSGTLPPVGSSLSDPRHFLLYHWFDLPMLILA